MKPRRVSRGMLFTLPLVALTLLYGCNTGSTANAGSQSQSSAQPAAPPQQLSPEGQAALRAIIQAGNLSDLRWPDFSDYQPLVQEFYDSYGDSLPWVRGMQPTPQARQMIASLLDADQKGCPRKITTARAGTTGWPSSNLRRPTNEADAVRFDAALTVCVMRYISDLHIGKVNPKHFDFGFNVEEKKYDLPAFSETRYCGFARCGRRVLAKVEPPYPGYKRTIQALHTYLQYAKK